MWARFRSQTILQVYETTSLGNLTVQSKIGFIQFINNYKLKIKYSITKVYFLTFQPTKNAYSKSCLIELPKGIFMITSVKVYRAQGIPNVVRQARAI